MSIKPDSSKQAKEAIFSKKIILGSHSSLFFNNSLLEKATTQKYLGLTLDHKLTFQYYRNKTIKKAMKGIGLLGKYLEHTHWLIYKSFLRRCLDYDDIVYDQLSSDPFF